MVDELSHERHGETADGGMVGGFQSQEWERVRLDEFVRDDRLRYRGSRANERVEDYSDAFQEHGGWGDFPPLKLIRLTQQFEWHEEKQDGFKTKRIKKHYDAGTLLLIGGFTRAAAADDAGLAEAPAVIESGTWHDALRLAWTENGKHGRPRDRDELWMVLDSIHDHPDHKNKSEREVAVLAGTSRGSVNRYRVERRKRMERATASVGEESPSLLASVSGFKDAYGRDVPEVLVEEFRSVPAAKKLTQSLREMSGKLLKLKYGSELGTQCQEPGLERWDVRDLSALLLEQADRGDATLPFLVCPVCDGDGNIPDPNDKRKKPRCEQCIGRGYLLRHEAETLPGGLESKARAAA